MQNIAADDLSSLVALAGNDQGIPRLQLPDSETDRLGAVADLACTRSGGQDGGADRSRVLAARIVVGDDDAVGLFGGDRTHQGALAGVTVAAGTEHDNQLARGIGPER